MFSANGSSYSTTGKEPFLSDMNICFEGSDNTDNPDAGIDTSPPEIRIAAG